MEADIYLQPGKPRSKELILTSLQAQLHTACTGVAQHVKNIQTTTGVKDLYTQYWIDHLLERAKAMQDQDPSRSRADIQKELSEWVEDHLPDIYSGFLTLEGRHHKLPFSQSTNLKIIFLLAV